MHVVDSSATTGNGIIIVGRVVVTVSVTLCLALTVSIFKVFSPACGSSPCLCVGEMAEAERSSTLAAIQSGADCGTKEMFDCLTAYL